MAFGLDFFTLAPGLRVAGDSLAYVYKFTKKGGQGDGKEGLEVGLTDDPAIKLLEADVSGYDIVTDRDAVYTALVSGGLTELVPGLAVGIDSLSSIETSVTLIKLGLAGAQPQLQFRSANVAAVTKVGDSGYVWDLPTSTFAVLKAAAETYQSDLKTKVEAMIAARIAADDTLTAAIAAQSAADVAARAALSGRLDTLEADPTTAAALAAGDAATLSSANTYTDTAVSNVIGTAPGVLDTLGEIADAINDDANVYTTLVASIAAVQTDVDGNESDGDAADAALSGRLDTLEADPTTATAVAAVQADVDANETASDAAEAALSGRLDTLEADPTTATALAAVQSDVDQNESDADAAIAGEATTRGNADTALSGRLDVLEADPTTQALLDAETTDRTEGDLNAIGQSNAYTDGLLNQYFGGASSEVKADSYNAVIEAGFIPTVDATGDQFKFNDADVASVTAIAVNHDSTAGRINWFEVFPTGSVMRVTRASDSAVFDFTVTQAGVGGTNERTKNFTVTTSSTGTLVNGDTLSISTLAGPDIATGADLTVGGDLTVSGTGVTTIAGQLTLGDGLYNGRLDTYEVRANIISRFGGTRSSGTPDPDSRVDFSNPTYLWLQTSNTAFPSADDEYVTVELKRGYLKAKKDANGLIFMDLGTSADPWKDLYLSGDVNCASINTTGSFSVGDVGSFSSPALPDGVSFANLMEAIGDALVARATTADPDFTGQVDIDTNARIEFADNLTKIHNVLRGTSINIGNNIELKPAAAGGRVEITGDLLIDASDFTDAADDTAAAAGVVVGQVYRNGSQLMVRVS